MKSVSVLIFGGSLAGLTLARDLARRSIAYLLAERNDLTTRHLKMPNTNVRSTELFAFRGWRTAGRSRGARRIACSAGRG